MAFAPWILATRNAGKLRELRALFATHAIDVIDLRDAGVEEDMIAEDAVEAYETFEENALAKARYFSALLPGRIVVADDSGLAVDALGGEPGVHSKRWSGRGDLHGAALDASNNVLLLARMGDASDPAARFVCAAAWSDGVNQLVERGEVTGRIVKDGRGTHGFGYDPHVYIDELGMTLAEATVAEKERVSHRGRAFVRLLAALDARGILTA
ncbi:MAG: non-canonical purine NTP pyrophosphatase [Gemmatimonadaceae bacterium]